MKKYILFGIGNEVRLKYSNAFVKKIHCIVDNDEKKWGKSYCGKIIQKPSAELLRKVVIVSNILEYDEKDRKRRKNNPDNKEKINHGIYGGQYYFNRMLQKFDKKGNVEDKEVKMVKAVAITIAQHNMYKSGSPKDNHFYPDKLHYESNFVINEDYPLLLFLALIDTVECVKKLGKTANRKCFFQAKTVLKSIRVRVESDSIEIDYSELKSRLDRKNDENLKRNYNDYMGAVKGLDKWTRFEAVEKEDVLRIHMKPRHENN